MRKNKKMLTVLSSSAIAALISIMISMPVYAKATAIDITGADGKIYEYQYEALKDSAVSTVVNGSSDISSKLYGDFAERRVKIKAYYDDTKNAYVDAKVVEEAAIEAILSDRIKTFNFKSFLEDKTTPTIELTPSRVTVEADGGVVIKNNPIGSNTELSDGGTHNADYVISSSGTFGSNDATKITTINGDIVINHSTATESESITLQNLNINGTLTVNFGSGNLNLSNVKVNNVKMSNANSN